MGHDRDYKVSSGGHRATPITIATTGIATTQASKEVIFKLMEEIK
jgi:hypothetical protein